MNLFRRARDADASYEEFDFETYGPVLNSLTERYRSRHIAKDWETRLGFGRGHPGFGRSGGAGDG